MASFILCSQCCWSKHKNFFQYFRMEPDTFWYILHNIRPYIKKKQSNFRKCISPEERLAVTLRYYTTHWHTRPEKNKMIWFRPSVGETCPCTSVQHGATETATTDLNAFVCSAVVGRVYQCKISAKYGCSVTTALALRQHLIRSTCVPDLVAWYQ